MNPNTHAASVEVVVARPRTHAPGPVIVPAVDLEPADPGSTSRTPRPTSTAQLPASTGHRTPSAPPATTLPVEAGTDGSDGSGGGLTWTPQPPVTTTDPSEVPSTTTTSRPHKRPGRHVTPSGTASVPGQKSHGPLSAEHRPTGSIVVVHPPAGQIPGPRGSASTPPAGAHGVEPGRTDVPGSRTHGSGAKQSTGSAAPHRHQAGSHAPFHPRRHPAPAPRHRLLDLGVLGV